jgi:hypothetical protein
MSDLSRKLRSNGGHGKPLLSYHQLPPERRPAPPAHHRLLSFSKFALNAPVFYVGLGLLGVQSLAWLVRRRAAKAAKAR